MQPGDATPQRLTQHYHTVLACRTGLFSGTEFYVHDMFNNLATPRRFSSLLLWTVAVQPTGLPRTYRNHTFSPAGCAAAAYRSTVLSLRYCSPTDATTRTACASMSTDRILHSLSTVAFRRGYNAARFAVLLRS